MNIGYLFELIENAKTVSDLRLIIFEHGLEVEMETLNKKYPALHFDLKEEDIEGLVTKNILNGQHLLQLANIPVNDPLVMLLISLIWKNGDLFKIQHIADGITGKRTSASKQHISSVRQKSNRNRRADY